MDSYSSNYSAQSPYQYQQETDCRKPFLRSVRTKNIITKKPIAPLPPTPPKIYKVEPMEFKNVVQKLTGAIQPTRLQEVAPPPLSISPPTEAGFSGEGDTQKMQKSFENSTYGALSPLGFSLSPSSLAWYSTMLLSPGTLASLEPSAVL